MPTSIPYNHPSLVLGNIADTKVMEQIDRMTRIQGETDAAQEKLNSLIQMKRSMSMTVNELQSMGIDMDTLTERLKSIDVNINLEATHYLETFLKNEDVLQELKIGLMHLGRGNQTPESPIDMTISVLKPKPFFSDSLKLDSQYFSMGENSEESTIGNLEKFVKNSAGKGGEELALAVSGQVANQARNHRLCGTLVVVANCTHRNVGVFEPLVINPDKAIKAWNTLYPSDRISSPEQEVESGGSDDGQHLTLITGAAYGSSFVGMVHILQTEEGQAIDFERVRTQLEEKLQIGGWLSHVSGGLGIDPQYLDDVKATLATQTISTHISVVTMGMIPTIKSNAFQSGAMQIVNLPSDERSKPEGDVRTAGSASRSAAEKNQKTEVRSRNVRNVLQSAAEVDKEQNNVLNINSLMTALDNYITLASGVKNEQVLGVPISFFTQRFTKGDLLELWSEKHYAEMNQKESTPKK